jgi:hypothetical protein
MTAEIVKSLNWVRSRNLIHNQFNFEWWNHKKNINLENLSKEKKIAIKIIGIKFDRKKLMKEEIVKQNDRDNPIKRKWKKNVKNNF